MTRAKFETRISHANEEQWREHATVREDALKDAPFKRWLHSDGQTFPVPHARFWCHISGLRSYYPPTHLRQHVLLEHAAQCAAQQMWHAAASGDLDRMRALCTDGVVVQWACSHAAQPNLSVTEGLEGAPPDNRSCARLQMLSCSLGPLHRKSLHHPCSGARLLVARASARIDEPHWQHGRTLLCEALQCVLPDAACEAQVAHNAAAAAAGIENMPLMRRFARSIQLLHAILALDADVNMCSAPHHECCVAYDSRSQPCCNSDRIPPLHFACRLDHAVERDAPSISVCITDVLLSHGANPSDRDSRYARTALHEACAVGSTRAAEALLHAGADTEIKDGEGHLPLVLIPRHARYQPLRDLCSALVLHRRDVTIRKKRRTQRKLTDLLCCGVRKWSTRQVRTWLTLEGHTELAHAFGLARVDGQRLAAFASNELAAYRLVSPFGGGAGEQELGGSVNWSDSATEVRHAVMTELAAVLQKLPTLLVFFGDTCCNSRGGTLHKGRHQEVLDHRRAAARSLLRAKKSASDARLRHLQLRELEALQEETCSLVQVAAQDAARVRARRQQRQFSSRTASKAVNEVAKLFAQADRDAEQNSARYAAVLADVERANRLVGGAVARHSRARSRALQEAKQTLSGDVLQRSSVTSPGQRKTASWARKTPQAKSQRKNDVSLRSCSNRPLSAPVARQHSDRQRLACAVRRQRPRTHKNQMGGKCRVCSLLLCECT